MKILCVAFWGLWCLVMTAAAALPDPDLLVKLHFAGAQKILADPQAGAFTNEFCSSEAVALRTETADKLAAWLPKWLQTNLNLTTPTPDGAAKLRPLFDDLQRVEWFLETRAGGAGGKVELALAARLDAARAQLWQSSLKGYFPEGSFKIANGWLVFDSTPALKLGEKLAAQAANPPANWADADINWPRLAEWFPLVKELGLPEMQFTITAPERTFHIDGKWLFPEDLALKVEPWRPPTNTIRVPFDSFTAARGFGKWLQGQSWTQPYQLTPAPNQVFIWAQPSFPYQTYAAMPVADAKGALAQLYSALAPNVAENNERDRFFLPVRPVNTNGTVITFADMPYIAPFFRALTEPSGQFLFMGLFVYVGKPQVLPPQLYARFAKKDVVFFHWEITSERMPQVLNLSQYGLMFTRHKQLGAESAALKWLQHITPGLTNMDTEIRLTGPAEMSFTRKAPGILSAVEFYALANWLDAPDFPGANLGLPPRKTRPPQFKMVSPPNEPGH